MIITIDTDGMVYDSQTVQHAVFHLRPDRRLHTDASIIRQ